MKHIPILALLCALLLFPLSSCVSDKTIDLALFVPAAAAWPQVESEYLRGIEDGEADGVLAEIKANELRTYGWTLATAMDEKNRGLLLSVEWEAMEPWAARGIEDALNKGDIGAGVKVSLVEQLAKFTETIYALQGR